jgi:hypothetical protein
MKQPSPASKMERYILLLLVSVLLVGLLVAIGFEIAEQLRLRAYRSQFPNVSLGGTRQSLAGLNLLTIPLFLAVVFARRYIVSTALTLLYLGMLAFGMYLRLDGRGDLGGEGFYQNYFTEFIAKSHWFEFLLPAVLAVIVMIHIKIHFRSRIHSGNHADLP